MPQQYMLDTDTASYGLGSRAYGLRLRLKHTPGSSLHISSVVAGEMLFGIRGLPTQAPLAIAVTSFFARASILPWDLEAAKAYADVRYALTTSGQLIGALDMMIAAHALATGCILVSNNTRHFSRLVPPLQLENWTEP